MIELKTFRTDKDLIIAGLKKRSWSDDRISIVDEVIRIDDERKAVQTELDVKNAHVNKSSKEIGKLFSTGQRDEADKMKAEISDMKQGIKDLEEALRNAKSNLKEVLCQIPNVPHESVPAGSSEDDNEVYQEWKGDLPTLYEGAQPHWDLADKHQLFDLKLGAKIAGSGFPLYRGKGAKLQRALISFFLDEAIAAGYEEFLPPHLVNEDSAFGTGSLPDKEGQMYHCTVDNLYLIPTAEVPITNIYREVTVDPNTFPVKMTAYTPCFRREAGSYGADVKGLNRVHQFDKVEIVQLQHPDKSYDTLMEMLGHIAQLLDKLELPYRILRLCGGDLTFASALTFDFEVYSAAQKRWLEVSSVSNFETFQSNRLNLKYKDVDGKNKLAHTLNGSALALARIVAAILENHQTEDGIVLPPCLHPYTGFRIID